MKRIKYKYLYAATNNGSETEHAFIIKDIPYTEENLSYAMCEAYNGEYTIEDDGVIESIEPTQLDRIEAQVTYTAMMTDTLLEV